VAHRDRRRGRVDRQQHIHEPDHYRRHPTVFEAYARVVLPYGGHGQDTHDRAVLELLSEQSPEQRWWLGYLDTGADDIVFPGAPMVNLYAGWHWRGVGPYRLGRWPVGSRGQGSGVGGTLR